MKNVINVYSISGLYYELYSPNVFDNKPLTLDMTSNNPLYNLNTIFWANILSESNLDSLFSMMAENRENGNQFNDIEKAVFFNQDLFKQLVNKAVSEIINQAITEKMMFAYMEQIEIVCRLMSKYLYSPFSLTIQDGFEEPTLSSEALIKGLFDENENPYLHFLEKTVFESIGKLTPQLIWINGQPKYSSLAIASKIKANNPQTVIAVRFHSSEYFSLNKIDNLLVQNKALFSLIDCVVLDDSVDTCNELERIVLSKQSLSNCRNLIYIDRDADSIKRTVISKVDYHFEECIHTRIDNTSPKDHFLSPHRIANLKLNPNTACYWNKCTFCGINKKYKFISNSESIALEDKIEHIKKMVSNDILYYWFEDEAIEPNLLEEFADKLLEENIAIFWQARSRIDIRYNDILAKKLYKAGLREIRFGLESANRRILGLMNKFPDDVSLETVENIVRMFTTSGVQVHFPMIVGYPSETLQERIDTYKYLIYLKEKYVKVSFNINVLMLDVSSDLFKSFPNYDIASVSFPCSPFDFLGNIVSFRCPTMDESRDSIDYKRNEFMRETLYPWMPITAQIKPNIFYRLSETIRNTLVWHTNTDTDNGITSIVEKNKELSIWKENEELYMIYNWQTHHLYGFSKTDFERFNTIGYLSICDLEGDELLSQLYKEGLLVPQKN